MFEINNVQKKLYVKKILDLIYLFILGLYIVRGLFDKSMFYLPWTTRYYEVLRIFMGFYLVVKICIYDIKCIKVLIFDILYLCIFYYIYKGTGYIFLLELGFFVLAAKDISYQKIMKFYAIVTSAIMAIIILGALTGCIEDLIYYKNDMFKHSFGIVYTTDFGAHIFFLVLTYLSIKKKAPNFYVDIALLILALVLYRYSGTRNTSGCIVILVLGNVYIRYSEKKTIKLCNKKNRWSKIIVGTFRFLDSCLVFMVPIFALISILCTRYFSPDNVIMNKINVLSSGRLQLGKNAIEKYGLSLWGSPFDMIGMGANFVTRTDYNFVDCSYVMIFIRYGLILFLLTMIGFIWLNLRVKKAKKRYMLVLLTVMALQSIMEYHLLEVVCNPFVLLIISDINDSNYKIIRNESYNKKLKYLGVIIMASIIIMNISYFLSYGRTVVTLLKLYEPEKNIFFVLSVIIVGIICILIINMLRILYFSFINRKYEKIIGVYSFICMLGIIIIISGIYACEVIIAKKSIEYDQTIQTGKLILEQLNQVGEYKLYIEDIPYLYMKEKGIDKNIIPGTPYRKDVTNAVVITTVTNEMVNLINAGYLCGQISDKEYIYTNDESAKKIIGDMGIKLNNFYTAVLSVDLLKLAESNGLMANYDGSLIIGGGIDSLNYGPWITLYRGIYRVNYYLELLNTDIKNGEIARIEISSYYGDKIIKEVIVNESDFDENGHCAISLETHIPDSVGVEFKLLLNGNTQLKLNYLNYLKIGAG